ncbi:MAG TPA: glycosyltransferase, partial [Chlamydiales bacterium]|nr:glycosyltransferase [Chlamydiales bacterium]
GRSNCCLLRHPENKGILYSLQEALQVAKGTHIYHASSDDYIEPDFFAKAMNLIEKNSSIGLCCGNPIFFTGEEEKRTHRYMGIVDVPQVIVPEELPSLIRRSNFSIAGVTSIYRRDLMLKYGGYRESLKSACDGFLIHQIAFQHPIGYIPEPFAAVRVHSSSYSAGIMQLRKVRTKLFAELIQAVCAEKKEVLASFKKSGVLLYFGKRFLLYLICRPRFWSFLPPIIFKQIVHKKLKLMKLLF